MFEPVDIIYVDKNIKYHKGTKKLYSELNFITYNKEDLEKMEVNSDEKFDYYWKYSKIGLNKFKFNKS